MADITKSQICVVIPAYNEEKNVCRVARAVSDLGFHALVVDDGSTDETVFAASRLPGIDVIAAKVNQGKGAALRRGFDWALSRNYSAIIVMDADGQHDPKELSFFVEALNKNRMAFVVGNRMQNPQGMPFIRRVTNRFMSWIISSLAGQKIPDSQCGYRALRREALERLSLKTSRFEIESEMLLEAARLGFPIGSIPIRSVYEGGKSQISPLRDAGRFIHFIFRYIFDKKCCQTKEAS